MDLRKEKLIQLNMLTCFLCKKAGIIVKKFNEEKLEKCRKIQAFRKKKNLIYKDVVLPKSLMQRGYHLQCYDKFIVLKSNNRKEFASMFSNNKVLINNIPPLKIDSPNAFKKNTASSSIEIPKLIEIPHIGTKTCDIIDLKVTPFKTYQMDEPSYVNPDISRGVILKSILTRKSPIKKDMTKDHYAFGSGMDLFRYGSIYNQPNLNFGETLGPKIVEMDSSANDVCLFCEKEQRKIGLQVELSEIAKEDEFEKVLEAAKAMEDEHLLEKLNENKVFSCHPLCRVEYRNQHLKITTKNCNEEDVRLVITKIKTEAFEALCAFIDDKIIDKNKTYLLTDLFERYKALLCEIQNTTIPLDVESSTVLNLQEKILTHYEGIIKITSKSKKKVVYKDGTTDFDSAFIENEDFKQDKIAFELRSEIRSMKRNSDGDIDGGIPEKLLRFIGSLIQGPAARSSYENSVKIKSVCENIVARVHLDD